MVYKDFFGGLSSNATPVNHETFNIGESNIKDNEKGKNITISTYQYPIGDTFNSLNKNSKDICLGLNKLIIAIKSILGIHNLDINYREILTALEKFTNDLTNINIEFEVLIKQLSDAVNEFKNNSKLKDISNNISNIKSCNETFDEGVSSIFEELKNEEDENYVKLINQIIDLCIASYKDDYMAKNPNSIVTDKIINSIKNSDGFKASFNKRLMESSAYFRLRGRFPVGMFYNGNNSQLLNSMLSKYINADKNKSKLNNKNTCYTTTGLKVQPTYNCNSSINKGYAFGNDPFLSFKDEINIILNNIKSCNYNVKNYKNKYGGAGEDNLPPPQDDNQDTVIENILDLYEYLTMQAAQFSDLRLIFVSYLKEYNNQTALMASVKNVMDATIKELFEIQQGDVIYKRTVHLSKFDVEYYRIMYAKMLNKKGVVDEQFIGAVNYILLFLSKLKFSDDDKKVVYEPELLEPVIQNVCEGRNLDNAYINVLFEEPDMQFSISLLDSLNLIVLNKYLKTLTSDVSIYAILNDFKKIKGDLNIFTKTTIDGIMYLMFIKSVYCKDVFPTIVNDKDVKEIKESRYIIPFAYIFDNCELSLIPYYMRLKQMIFENYMCIVLFTIGYSGVGKSVLLYGKTAKVEGEVNIKGLLQYCLQAIDDIEEVRLEIIEIYGRCLPLYESFNPLSDDPDEGYTKSISWIKVYTDHQSFRDTGKYDHTKDKGDKFNDLTFKFETDNNLGSLITDNKEIKKYFANRMTDNFYQNLYLIRRDMITTFLENYDNNCIIGVEETRKRLGTIKFTPNNPNSSRSTLAHTFFFKIKGKYISFTIIDFPGKEDPIPTYIYDSQPRDKEVFKTTIKKDYGDMYTADYVDGALDKIIPIGDNNTFNRSDTFYNILPFNPFILLTIDYNTNIILIDNINNFINEYRNKNGTLKKEIDDEVEIMIKNILNTKFIEDTVEMRSFLNEDNYLIAAGIKEYEKDKKFPLQFPSIALGGKPKISGKLYEKYKLTKDIDQLEIESGKYSFVKTAANNPRINGGGGPNIIRYYYIVSIFKELLNSKIFSSNDIISILLSTLYLDIKDKEKDLSIFITGSPKNDQQQTDLQIDLKSKLFCNKLNNMFEAYFINETIGLIFANLINTSKSDKKDEQLKKILQGEKLKITDTADYLIKRLNSNAEHFAQNDNFRTKYKEIYEYNPLVDPTIGYDMDEKTGLKSNRIYNIGNYKTDVYDDKMRQNIKEETQKLYDYSRVISDTGHNIITRLLKIDDCSQIMLYVLSNVLSALKCPGIISLIEDQYQLLASIYNEK